MLFEPYILPVGKYKVSFHRFDDVIQVFLPIRTESKTSLEKKKAWIKINFLNFNEDKTDVIWFDAFGPWC